MDVLSKKQLKNGGFPPRDGDKRASPWTTAVMLLAHRQCAFLSPKQVNKSLRFFVSSFCRDKQIDENEAFGWGSFSDVSNKAPIPVITATVLLSLCGIQNLDIRLNRMFEMGLSWLLITQKEDGDWKTCTPEDHYSKLFIILALHSAMLFYQKTNQLYTKAIESSLKKAQGYYKNVNDDCIVVKMIRQQLELPVEMFTDGYPDVFEANFVRPNQVTENENFSFHKYDIVLAVYSIALSNSGVNDHQQGLQDMLTVIYGRRDGNLFWADSNRSCLWLSAEIVLATIMLNEQEQIFRKNARVLYRGIGVCEFSLPIWVKVWIWGKLLLRLRRPLNSAWKSARNWISNAA